MPYFENEAARLYYEETGTGKPLVLLHGFGWDGRQWRRQVERFSADYRVITLDARGHGKSSLPPGKVDNGLFWRDVVALLDRLEIGKAAICGLSMGGHVAIQVAIHAGDRVERLILIGSICTNSFNRFERMVVPVNRFCQRLMPMKWIAWCVAEGLGGLAPDWKPYIREVVGSMSHNAYNRAWRAVSSMESRDGLGEISCPSLLLAGDRDRMTGRQQAYLRDHIAGSRLVAIKNAGHATNLDNPDQVEKEIAGFLNEKESGLGQKDSVSFQYVD